MENILIIAYYYPPLGGAGVQRTLKFSKYLAKMNYNVSVLTVLNDDDAIKDSSLNSETIDGIKVYRARQKDTNFFIKKIYGKRKSKSYEFKKDANPIGLIDNIKRLARSFIKKILVTAYTNINIPDDKISWKDEAIKQGIDIIEKDNIDFIYSTSGPYTSHLIAYELKKKTGKRWIADFRDQWVSNPFVEYFWLTKFINKKLEARVVKDADIVVSVSQPIIDDFINRYNTINKKKFYVITNGYDEEDFLDFKLNKKNDKFVITYNGTIYGKRSPVNFFQAVDNLIKDYKIPKENIAIKFIGRVGNDGMEQIKNFTNKYNNIVEIINYLPHKSSIKQLEESAALLLIIEDGEGSDGIYTGKVFEYIRSGRFIIGIVPNGVAKNLILDTNTGLCCHPNSVDEIAKVVYEAYKIWIGKEEPLKINLDEVRKYEREEITKQLSGIIRSI